MLICDETRVVKFWDNEALLEKNSDNNSANKILSFKRKCFKKVSAGELSMDEYREIETFVKNMFVNRFVDFYDMAILYLDLNKEDCYHEVQHLNSMGLVSNVDEFNSFYKLMMTSIFELHSKILSLGSVKVTHEEINPSEDILERIQLYNDLLSELKNLDSDYVNLLKEVYEDFINLYVKNADLREKMLTLDYKIINVKAKYIRTILANENRKIVMRKNVEATCYKTAGLAKGRKRKNEKKIYRRK